MQSKFMTACFFLLVSSFAGAAAVCPKNLLGAGRVVVNDNQTLKVSGLTQLGIPSGLYFCSIQGSGFGWLSAQSRGACFLKNNSSVTIKTWFIQGLNAFGLPAASVALYRQDGIKVFESGCLRN